MITHHLKVAVRNLLKYKTQTFISILGLAIGLACFIFSLHWLRYLIAILVLLTVFRQVKKAANENPAEVINNE